MKKKRSSKEKFKRFLLSHLYTPGNLYEVGMFWDFPFWEVIEIVGCSVGEKQTLWLKHTDTFMSRMFISGT